MQESISANPEAHPVAPGTGGVRKVYLLFLYAKNEQSDMNNADRLAARKFVEVMKNAK
jgi:hypothetical protein